MKVLGVCASQLNDVLNILHNRISVSQLDQLSLDPYAVRTSETK